MAILIWLKSPRRLIARVQYWMWEKRHPNLPWLCPRTIAFCEARLEPSMKGLEFGSGRSTRWFSKKLGHLISVEDDQDWHAIVRKQLQADNATNVDYRLVPLDHPRSEGERETYSPVPKYVAVADGLADKSIQFALVDGHYRTHCVRHVVPKLAPGGYLIVDDVNLWSSPDVLPVPSNWRIVDDSSNGIKRCIIWQAS